MEYLTLPPDLFEGVFLSGVAVLALARGLLTVLDTLLNRFFDVDIPDTDIPGYVVITAAVMVLIAVVSEVFGIGVEILGFFGLFWKILAALLGGIIVQKLPEIV